MKRWLLATLFMAVSIPAFAAEAPKAEPQDQAQVGQQSRKAEKEAAKAERAALREKVKAFRQSQKEKAKSFREQMRAERETFRKSMEEKRKAHRAEMDAAREAFLQANPEAKAFMEKHGRGRGSKSPGKPAKGEKKE